MNPTWTKTQHRRTGGLWAHSASARGRKLKEFSACLHPPHIPAQMPPAPLDTKWAKRISEGLALLRLVAPIALISLVNMGMSVTDAIMVSAFFGTEALAAKAVGSDLYSIVFYLCASVLAGIAPFYTAAVAQANTLERARIERIGWMTVGLPAVFAVPLIWLAPLWLEKLGIQQTLLTNGQGYTRVMALTLVPMLGVILYRTVLTAAEKPRVFLKITLTMLPLNAIGNYVFMTGVGPIPSFGPTGAGISSLIVAMASLSILVIVIRGATSGSVSQLSGEATTDWRGLAVVPRVGIPIGIATVAELGIFLGATLYTATLGAADVAAHTLALRTAGVVYALPAALLQASMVRMARAESLHNRDACRALNVQQSGAGSHLRDSHFPDARRRRQTLCHGLFRRQRCGHRGDAACRHPADPPRPRRVPDRSRVCRSWTAARAQGH